jgi:hypothetical protein
LRNVATPPSSPTGSSDAKTPMRLGATDMSHGFESPHAPTIVPADEEEGGGYMFRVQCGKSPRIVGECKSYSAEHNHKTQVWKDVCKAIKKKSDAVVRPDEQKEGEYIVSVCSRV